MRYNIITDIADSSTHQRPLFLFDSGLNCIFTGDPDLFGIGDSLLSVLRDDHRLPFDRCLETALFIRGNFYYTVIEPVRSENGENWCKVELIDKARALRIYDMTDAGAEKLPVLNAMQYHLADIWQCFYKLRKALPPDSVDLTYDIEKDLYKLGAVISNDQEYLYSIYGVETRTVFDLGKLCCKLEKRCNQALAKCGRRFELVMPLDEHFVSVSSRRAVIALVNVIQNAMLYSPQDTEPIMTVYSEEGYVVVRIVNESIMYSGVDFSTIASPQFNYQRVGSGLPMVRAFADAAGGKLEFDCRDGVATLKLLLPRIRFRPDTIFRFENAIYDTYTTGIPDFLDIKMREVVDFFGEKKKDS